MKKEDNEVELILKNLGLVLSQSSTFRKTSLLDKQDYKQVGIIGLLKAIRKLDPSKASLATFSYRAIKNELLLEYRKNKKNLVNLNESDLTVPSREKVNIEEFLPEMSEIDRKIIDKKIEGYTILEIANLLDMTQSEVKNKLKKIYKNIKDANE